jgi:hypothetical protein
MTSHSTLNLESKASVIFCVRSSGHYLKLNLFIFIFLIKISLVSGPEFYVARFSFATREKKEIRTV